MNSQVGHAISRRGVDYHRRAVDTRELFWIRRAGNRDEVGKNEGTTEVGSDEKKVAERNTPGLRDQEGEAGRDRGTRGEGSGIAFCIAAEDSKVFSPPGRTYTYRVVGTGEQRRRRRRRGLREREKVGMSVDV